MQFARAPRHIPATGCARRIGRRNRYRCHEVREPITLMVPLIWLVAHDGQTPTIVEAAVPGTIVLDGISACALDKHTRLGLEAIRSLVKHNSEIREFLETHVAPAQRHKAAYMAAFYADAAPLASKLLWDGADQLESLGTEADLLKVGVPAERIGPLLRLFRANVHRLNELRARTFCKKNGALPRWQPSSGPTGRARPWPF